jgi:tRNA(Ile)-lysidine synthase
VLLRKLRIISHHFALFRCHQCPKTPMKRESPKKPPENALLKGVLAGWPAETPIWCGFSGGRDSTALLCTLVQARAKLARSAQRANSDKVRNTAQVLPSLSAIHVHHGLSPHADAWAGHVQAQCAAWDVPLTVVRAKVSPKRGDSVEEAARDARYAAFAKHVPKGAWLALAHHAGDQAETWLVQALRGAGPAGLAGMSKVLPRDGITLWRPWLDVAPVDIAKLAQAQSLQWIEDESNASERFTRNWVRHRVMPVLEARSPGAHAALARAAMLSAESAELAAALAVIDLNQVQSPENALQVDVSKLLVLGDARARNALRAWFGEQGLRAPSAMRLAELMRQLRDSQSPKHQHGRMVWVHAGVTFAQQKRQLVMLGRL